MPGLERVLERYPWLLPLAWAVLVEGGSACDPVVLSGLLGVPSRLARSLAWHGRKLGLCEGGGLPRVARRGREFAAETSGFYLYARIRGRRVSGYALSKSGVEGEASKRRVERARELLGLA